MNPYPSNSAQPSPPQGQRKGSFSEAETVESACAHVRGVLIARLDDVYDVKILPLLLRFRVVEWEAVEIFQEIQLALFPEEFAEDHQIANRLEEVRRGKLSGLVPRATTGYLNQCGADRLLVIAQKLGAKLRRNPVRVDRESQGTMC